MCNITIFSNDFVFEGSLNSIYRQIGNAVLPLLAGKNRFMYYRNVRRIWKGEIIMTYDMLEVEKLELKYLYRTYKYWLKGERND